MGVPYCRLNDSVEDQIFGAILNRYGSLLVKMRIRYLYLLYDADAGADAKGHVLARSSANQKLAHYPVRALSTFFLNVQAHDYPPIEVLRRRFIPLLSLKKAL